MKDYEMLDVIVMPDPITEIHQAEEAARRSVPLCPQCDGAGGRDVNDEWRECRRCDGTGRRLWL